MLEIIRRTLEPNKDLIITGFGKFSIQNKTVRRGRNPVTGQQMILRPRLRVTFYCSGKLRERMNGQ